MTGSVAADLVRDFPEDRIRRQIEVVDWLRETKPKRVKDVGAYLAEAIRKDFAPPAGFREPGGACRGGGDRPGAAGTAGAGPPGEGPRAGGRGAGPGVLGGAAPGASGRALEAAALAGADPADRAAYEAATGPARRLLQVGLRDAHIRRLLGLPAAD